jgi:peptidoglycan/LPS O-acetylase OafA/YrhL
MAGSGKRFTAGDPLRAVAALAVVAFHITLPGVVRQPNGDPFGFLTGPFVTLRLGIYLFFVLSGYLLARPFIVAFHTGEPLPRLSGYTRNRLLRIVPAFWAVTLLVLIRFGDQGSTTREVLAVFGFVQTYDEGPFTTYMVQGWTLGAEMLFYLLLPVAAIALTRTLGRWRPSRARLLAAVAVLGGAFTVILVVRITGDGRFAQRPRPPVMLFAFAPGVALAAAEVLGAGRWLHARRGSAIAVACFAAGLALLLLVSLDAFRDVVWQTLLGTLGCSLLVAGPLVLEWTRQRTWRWLDNSLMHGLGVRSYAIYLVHVPVIKEIGDVYTGHGPWAGALRMALLALPATLLAAEVVHRLVEVPFLSLRARWRRSPAQSAVGEPAPAG